MKKAIMYAGWMPGKRWDRQKLRNLGIGGPMIYNVRKHIFERCTVTPETMARLLELDAIPNPGSWTAYYEETDENLPRHRQLWGGAPVQL